MIENKLVTTQAKQTSQQIHQNRLKSLFRQAWIGCPNGQLDSSIRIDHED
jgi:hypothetical protein